MGKKGEEEHGERDGGGECEEEGVAEKDGNDHDLTKIDKHWRAPVKTTAAVIGSYLQQSNLKLALFMNLRHTPNSDTCVTFSDSPSLNS